jgi:hypothetical protein
MKLTKKSLDQRLRNLSLDGWDISQELQWLSKFMVGLDLPRLRIEHDMEGDHRFFIDKGESYVSDVSSYDYLSQKTLPMIVLMIKNLRVLWFEDEDTPACRAVDGVISGSNPVASSCEDCIEAMTGGACRRGAMLYIWPLWKGHREILAFTISPSSLGSWRDHQSRLLRANIPLIAANTIFTLEDTISEPYRWARVHADLKGIVRKSQLEVALKNRRYLLTRMKELKN